LLGAVVDGKSDSQFFEWKSRVGKRRKPGGTGEGGTQTDRQTEADKQTDGDRQIYLKINACCNLGHEEQGTCVCRMARFA